MTYCWEYLNHRQVVWLSLKKNKIPNMDWGKENFCTLWTGIQISTETIVELPLQK